MECLKNCCRNFMKRKAREHESQVIKMKMPPTKALTSGRELDEGRRGLAEDYLLSRLPPGGREVPFVLPTFKASYVQPRGARFPNLQAGPQSSARCTYAERKAELLGTRHPNYSPEASFHQGQMAEYLSPGSARRDTLRDRDSTEGPQSPGWTLKPGGPQRLSSSMFDLSSPQSRMQRFDSVSSVLSSTSSAVGSVESSLDSITLSGDERDLGKVCVRLNYQEALEQVWITLVQCSDLNLPPDGAEQPRIGFKGIITIPKPVQFKSSVKDHCQDASFMETFVFALRLQQLRCSALVLRLQTHNPKKRTVAECVLSLRQLGPEETDHWLDLNSPSKSSVCHSELHLTTCFQPVNGRLQLQILAAQNLPASSSPLTQAFFVKAEMHQSGQVLMKKKTRVTKAPGGQCHWAETFHFRLAALGDACSLSVKLYSRSSVRRKQCLGQVHLGSDSPVPEAVEQWKDMMANPEKVVTAWHRLSAS
ncbi:putative tandem C2 domains nuclear protein [Scophthalmus maximus]|uniref:Putative tandem C2 domains nuclear protein n=1 Tax=Scophthalmus maximus TaxID=52904 RepID=A0A2U9CHY1_SCOMX|nr:tandem C2 domains nuclear protein [Scophthalmus maximus]XP_035467069.1 tandem C2 domains nuclear protein [Scophthalmus maximus]AWP16088.1 putative tandem C2 domains nuclear protein [Scophthalmus maximus]